MNPERVLRIDEQMYGCEELPEGQPVCCDVLLEDEAGARRVLAVPDAALTAQGIEEGCWVRQTAAGMLERAAPPRPERGTPG